VPTPRTIGVALAIAALALGGCTAGQHGSGTPGGTPAGHDPALTRSMTGPMFEALSADLRRHDRHRFLASFAGAAKQPAALWWDNMAALGFSTGVFYPEDAVTADVELDAAGDGTVKVWAGTHATLDPVESDTKKAYVPLTSYQLTVHQDRENSPIRITGWKSLMHAPWDTTKLYVVRSRHAEVATYPSEKRLAASLLPDAERAAEYDLALFKRNDSFDIKQTGFIVFASDSASRRAGWFHTGPQPRGWIADPAGSAKPLPGSPGTIVPGVETNGTGGARVVFHSQGSSPENAAVLVHEFVHVVFAIDTIWAYSDSDAAPAWTAEGIARLVESMYRVNPSTSAATLTFNLNAMKSDPDRTRFQGRPPTDAQLYNGSAASGSFWYDVAASVYGYIAVKYGTFDAFYAARIAYTDNSTPFAAIVKSRSGGTITFYRPSVIQQGWADWYRQTY
jgi:hypothetical protein